MSQFDIRNSYGNKQAWRWIKKNKWLDIGQPLTEREFGLIIKAINNILQDQLLKGKEVVFPHRMGKLEIRKYKNYIKYRNGKLRTNLLVDWKKTRELWKGDENAHVNKVLVRYESQENFTIYYDKSSALFGNKSFYKFLPTRTLKKKLRDKIVNNEIDAFLLKKKDELYKH